MTSTTMDIVALDRIAVREATRVVDLVQDNDWTRDTPCAGWTLRRLVTHMTAQHHGFAAAAHGAGEDPAHWREPEHLEDPAGAHRAPATEVLDAFAEQDATGRMFAVPELGGSFPGQLAIGFHFIDYVVHAWDVAAALGTDLQLPDAVLGAALMVARRIPTDPDFRAPGAPFGPALAVPEGADPLQETLLLLGRTPGQWPTRT